MIKQRKILIFFLTLTLFVLLTGCGRRNLKTSTSSNYSVPNINSYTETNNNNSDDTAIDDVKSKISEIMDFRPVYKEIGSEDYVVDYLNGYNLNKFVSNAELPSSVNDICFYSDTDDGTLYLYIMYDDDTEVLLQAYDNNFDILFAADGMVAVTGDQLFPDQFVFLKQKIDETIWSYSGEGELLCSSEGDMDAYSIDNDAQYLSGTSISFRDAYIFDSSNEKVIIFNMDTSQKIDEKYSTGYIGVRVKLIGVKDGVEKELPYYTRSDDVESGQFFFGAQRVDPFDDSQIVPLTDIAPMTIDADSETVLMFGINWDGYDQYILNINDTDTGDFVSFTVDSSEIIKCSYEEYVAKRYEEMSSGLSSSKLLNLDEFEIELYAVVLSEYSNYVALNFKNISSVPQGIKYIRVQALDENGNISNLYSGNNTLINNLNPGEEILYEWNDSKIKTDQDFSDNYLIRITVVVEGTGGNNWIYTFFRTSNLQ